MSAHVCSFSALPDPPRGGWTYGALKEAALKAGRFSEWDVPLTKRGGELFIALVHDPELETLDLGYPWTGVRRREATK